MIKSTFKLEQELLEQGYEIIIGIDEVGRGPLAGPVVACATTVRNFQFLISNNQNFHKKMELIRDSKTLSEKQRESLYDFIQDHFHVGVGICDHNTIDRVNILEASFLAMKSAVTSLKKEIRKQGKDDPKIIILLDGNKKIPNFSLEQQAIVGGDKLIKSISAASIIAKVTRDRIMLEMHQKYPEYNFAKHKGYGTAFHMEALKKFGPCEIHRKSFAPVKKSTKER